MRVPQRLKAKGFRCGYYYGLNLNDVLPYFLLYHRLKKHQQLIYEYNNFSRLSLRIYSHFHYLMVLK